jgi:hypothetical protein
MLELRVVKYWVVLLRTGTLHLVPPVAELGEAEGAGVELSGKVRAEISESMAEPVS